MPTQSLLKEKKCYEEIVVLHANAYRHRRKGKPTWSFSFK